MNETSFKELSLLAQCDKVKELSEQLKTFGWTGGIYALMQGIRTHGFIYEKKEYEDHEYGIKPTAMNCFAIIQRSNPDLIVKLIHQHELDEFIKLICKISMYMEIVIPKFKPDNQFDPWK